MTFRQAVEKTVDIKDGYHSGLKALEQNSERIKCSKPRCVMGSICLDEKLKSKYPEEPRWDYGIGIKQSDNTEQAIWVEVHPASSTHIDEVLRKLNWLRTWLRDKASALNGITKGKEGNFFWVATDGTINITPGSAQAKKLAAAGIIGPKRVLKLK